MLNKYNRGIKEMNSKYFDSLDTSQRYNLFVINKSGEK